MSSVKSDNADEPHHRFTIPESHSTKNKQTNKKKHSWLPLESGKIFWIPLDMQAYHYGIERNMLFALCLIICIYLYICSLEEQMP